MPFVEYSGEVISGKQDKTFEKGAEGFKLDSKEDLAKQLGDNWWHLPATLAAGAAAWEAGKAVNSWLKSKQRPEQTRIDPTFNPPDNPPPPPGNPPATPAGEQRLNLQDVIDRTKAVNAPVPPGPIQRAVIPRQLSAGNNLFSSSPKVPVIPTVTDAVAAGADGTTIANVAISEELTKTASEETTTTPKKGRPAGAKNLTPEERLAKKGVLPGMTPEQASMRNYLLGTYGGKENPAALQAYDIVKDILGYAPAYPPGSKGGGLAPEETGKILQYRKENIPGPKVNLTRDMKTVLKRGGPAAVAALVLTPEFAKASTEEQRQLIGEALLPIGLAPSEAGAPTLPPDVVQANRTAYENFFKLGSPLAQTEAAKEFRLREKAGAGRGVAPASAYKR